MSFEDGSTPALGYDGLIVDLDGVVWLGGTPIDGAAQAIGILRARGTRVVFVTNDPQSSREQFADRLTAMGVPATAEDVVTSAAATARYLASDRDGSGRTALVVGGPALRAEIERAGLDVVLAPTEASAVDVVVVGGHDGFDYAQLAAAARAVRGGAALYATGRDAVFPTAQGPLPATGAILASIEVAAGTTATVVGKPEPLIFEIARDVLRGCRRVAVVGDHLDSDIAGAKRAGYEAILVLSGTTTANDLAGARTSPDLVVPDLAALVTGRRTEIEPHAAGPAGPFEVDRCTHQDYLAILTDLDQFWADAAERVRRVHHPMFVHEFGDTAWVVRADERIVAYLFGLWSQTEPAGYIHLVAVRKSHRGRGIARWLYERFEALARERGCSRLKAVTSPASTGSVEFHRRLGFSLLGERNNDDVPVVRDYLALGEPRVVFEKRLS